MKKLVFLSMAAVMLFSCNNDKKEAATTDSGKDVNALYEQHLAIIKANIAAFENKDMEANMANVSDTATWNSPAYGDTVQTKAHWKESMQYWADNWDSLHLVNPIFLGGMDPETNKQDGSVRYYGVWEGVHKATGKHTTVSIYEYFNFNTDHKIRASGTFFDVGGLMNAVSQK